MKFKLPDMSFYRRRRWTIIGVFSILGISLIVTISDYGLYNRFKLEYERDKLKKDIIRLEKENDSLIAELEMLKNDTNTIERIAREKYGFKRRNEKVFIINYDSENK